MTALTGDAHAHGSPLAMAWVASLAAFRPHGQFCPFAPFSSVVDDRTAHEGEQRRRLADLAGILGVPKYSVEPSVCLATHPDAHALFRAEPRSMGYRVWNFRGIGRAH